MSEKNSSKPAEEIKSNFDNPVHENYHRKVEKITGKEIEIELGEDLIEPTIEPVPDVKTNMLQLRLWSDDIRSAPSHLLRSALFSIVKRGRRKAFNQELMAAFKGTEIKFTGWQLDQSDLEVWMEAVHEARPTQESAGVFKIHFQERSFLKAIGRHGGGSAIAWLRNSIGRLQTCGVSLTIGDYEYQGSLVEKFAQDKKTGRYFLILNSDLVGLFQTGYTKMHLQNRLKLKTNFAKWLQAYILSHKNPHQIGLERLKNLCGSETKSLRKFRQQIGNAMDELEKHNVLHSWEFVSDGKTLKFTSAKQSY